MSIGFEPGLARHPTLVAKLKEFQSNPSSLVFVSLAEEYRKLGFAAQALEILEEGLFFHKDLLAAFLVKARAFADLKRFADALALLQELLRRSPEHVRALQLQAEIYLHLGQRKKAMQSLQKIVFLFPGDRETAARVAEIVELLEVPAAPITTVEPIHSSTDTTGRLADFQVSPLASFDVVTAPINQLEQLEEGSLQHQEAPIATRTIAELYIRQGLQQKAIEVLRRILRDDPQSEWASDTLHDLQGNSALPSKPNKVVFDHKIILHRKAQFLGRALARFQLGTGSRRSFS